MCGIGMALGRHDAARRARVLADALAHRGPDDAGVEVVADLSGASCGALAHRRLAILDLSAAGHQPMASADGRWVIAFNGEIYNFESLAAELRATGVMLRGHSDTEVIVEGVARHGVPFVRRLRGMYALILWDRAERCAHLVRDPFGIKPLYVAEADGAVVASSELRALLATDVVARRIAPDAVHAYLAWGSVPEPLTMIDGVRMIPAGAHVRVAVRDGVATMLGVETVSPPWAPSGGRACTDRAEALARVREALADSVRHHLVSDVPVALFLSGGIDSSAVVALAASSTDRPLETFTITFDERAYDEAPFARTVAARYGTHHHEIRLTSADLFAELPAAIAAMDQPSLDGLNTYAVSRAVRDHGLKVVLSGLGGDELFAGYPAFRRARQAAALGAAPRAVRRFGATLARRMHGPAGKLALLLEAEDVATGAYRASRALFAGRLLAALSERPHGPELAVTPPGLSPLQTVSWHELTGYMRNTLLRDSDVFSMAHALELRVPFVDPVVAATVLEVDDSLKLAHGRSKPLLVDALGDLLPREVWDRPKQGFTIPFAQWMRESLRAEVAEALCDPARVRRVGIAPAATAWVWRGFLDGRAGISWSRPWALYTLVRWAETVGAEVALDRNAPVRALATLVPA